MLLTVEEVGYVLQKKKRHCYGLLACGRLRGIKVTPRRNSEHTSWRVPEQSILEYAERNREYRREEVEERMKELREFLEAAGVQWYPG